MSDLPYRAEYSKSGRASCRGCKSPIAKEVLRLAVMVQSPVHDGKTPNWYHFACFFGKQRPRSVADIAHVQSLRWEDQEKIKAKFVGGGSAPAAANGKGKKRAAAKATSTSTPALTDFSTEYAKSNRSTCQGCELKIMKGEVRLSLKDYETEVGRKYGGQDLWHHLDCFAQVRVDLEFFASGADLPGIKTLRKEDQQAIKAKLPKIAAVKKEEVDEPAAKKRKAEPSSAVLKEQSETLFKYRDGLKAQLKKKDLASLLEYNEQDVPAGEENILDRLADLMAFGQLPRCSECKDGQLVFRSGVGYQCTGSLTEWTKCEKVHADPKRKPCKIPTELKEHEFLAKYKYVRGKRLVVVNHPTASASVKEEESSGPKVIRARPPLTDMEFVIIGKTERPRDQIKKDIEKLGGRVGTKLHNKLAAIISTPDEVEKMSSRMEQAKACDVQVVPEDFLEEVKDGGALLQITKKSICSWGSDPSLRIPQPSKSVPSSSKSKSKSIYTKSMPSKVKLKLKGGAAVDPDSGLEDCAHVLQSGGDIYSAVLGVTDVQSGKNSYYKLQVLESDGSRSKFWVFRAWGRIGTIIGSNKLEPQESRHEALEHFRRLYEEKTGNMWEARDSFQKVAGRMYPLDIDYGQGDEVDSKVAIPSSVQSKLAKPVQDLVNLIFDIATMKKVMLEFELDLEKMPLGKLSRRQMQKALSVLTELQDLVRSSGSRPRLIDASNRFYTLVPHDFGIDMPPIIDSEDTIKLKVEMLDSLMEIELAYNLLKSSDADAGSGSLHPTDAHYAKLDTDLQVLERDSEEFRLLQTYVTNTHADTHKQYNLEILEVFKVKRAKEEKRYKPFKKLNNRKLLWHGSRLTNFAGILSQGLRIAPPEAPVTGYMFGKGIYFADMVSKSANYCCTSRQAPTGILLLCEVALGDMYECHNAEYIEKLPKGKQSCKGLGMTHPDPGAAVVGPDGVEVPVGKGVSAVASGQRASLLYNEYIVYDVAQVNVKYLLKMDFKHSY